jgi:hypothetical protein
MPAVTPAISTDLPGVSDSLVRRSRLPLAACMSDCCCILQATQASVSGNISRQALNPSLGLLLEHGVPQFRPERERSHCSRTMGHRKFTDYEFRLGTRLSPRAVSPVPPPFSPCLINVGHDANVFSNVSSDNAHPPVGDV